MPRRFYIPWVPSEGLMKRMGRWHIAAYRATRGILGARMDGLDILLLETRGRLSGEPRTVPLPYFSDGDRFVLVASFGGSERQPAWFYNLTACGAVQLQVKGQRTPARAEAAGPAERARLWAAITREHPRYLRYQEMTRREIPLVIVTATPDRSTA